MKTLALVLIGLALSQPLRAETNIVNESFNSPSFPQGLERMTGDWALVEQPIAPTGALAGATRGTEAKIAYTNLPLPELLRTDGSFVQLKPYTISTRMLKKDLGVFTAPSKELSVIFDYRDEHNYKKVGISRDSRNNVFANYPVCHLYEVTPQGTFHVAEAVCGTAASNQDDIPVVIELRGRTVRVHTYGSFKMGFTFTTALTGKGVGMEISPANNRGEPNSTGLFDYFRVTPLQ